MTAVGNDDGNNRMTLSVQITRYELPRLFEVLLGVPSGKMRANRLRALADKGLLVEVAGLVLALPVAGSASQPSASAGAGPGAHERSPSGTSGGPPGPSAAAVGAAQLFFGEDEA